MKRILTAAILLLVMGAPAAFAKTHYHKHPHPSTKHPYGHHPHRKS